MNKKWWKESVIYQIYPRSFYDSNADGIGDIRGIIEKLDYIVDLGVDVIWLNPVYESPNVDNGYDISDYQSIMSDFGTLDDFKELLKKLHENGIKLIMDLVVNHTSDMHPWFIESRSSKDNPKRDYYIWHEGKDKKEPNNWEAYFTGSAWELDSETNEYYLHLFSPNQPDLNWKNNTLRHEIYSMMKWWLDFGIDGFRMDVINLLAKKEGFPNSTKQPTHPDGYVYDVDLYTNQEGIHQILKEMNAEVLSKYDIMTVGETDNIVPEVALPYVDEKENELNMVFHFEISDKQNITLKEFKDIQKEWYKVIENGGWNSQFLNNHDTPRQVSRYGDDGEHRVYSAKMLAALIHTMPGTPYVYQGEEIGMTNVAFDSIDDYRDISTINRYKKQVASGIKEDEALKIAHKRSRDNGRTPMQWNDKKNAGFSHSQPWLGLNPNYRYINVENQKEDSDSVLNFYKKLIQLRRQNPIMVYGDFKILLEDDENIFAYTRNYEGKTWLIAVNFYSNNQHINIADLVESNDCKVVLSNYKMQSIHTTKPYELKPYEVIILEY